MCKVSELIDYLQKVLEEHGDVNCQVEPDEKFELERRLSYVNKFGKEIFYFPNIGVRVKGKFKYEPDSLDETPPVWEETVVHFVDNWE